MRGALVLAGVVACSGGTADPPAPAPAPRRGPVADDSSVAARDYIGPSACGECHPDQHAQWRTSLHAVMNQRADTGAVIGDFDTTLAYAGGEARFETDARGPVMSFARGDSIVRYRVTRTIGRRGLQEYVGVEEGMRPDERSESTRGGNPAGFAGRAGGGAPRGIEVRLPFGWWPRGGGWFPQPYFDPWLDERELDPYVAVREPWAERCPWCHSTYPFAQRIARASAPHPVGHGLEQHFVGPAGTPRLALAEQVTVGISCESCHLGGRAHAAGAPIHFVPLGAEPRAGAPLATTFAIERRDPAITGGVCAQCHSGPSPRLPDGTALRNSSESLDLAASPCTTIRCTDCHDPHRGGASEARAIAACTGCHAEVAPHAGSGHDAVSCLDCHMPRVVMGIDRFVRSHRISSPGDPRLFAIAAPNACNLCHLDRSFRWTADELRLRHDVRLDPSGWPSGWRDDPDASAGEAWLASPRPGIRLVAAAAYARGKLGRYVLPELLRGLDDPLAYVRMWTRFAVEDVLGRRLRDAEYDARAAPELRRKQLEKLRR